jgi:CBS domain-containing protein
MTRDVECLRPTDSIVEAARRMKKWNIGSLPVCGDDQRLIGMITDRDIVIRGVTDRRDLQETKVEEIMTDHVEFCLEDQPAEHAARLMRQKQIRRLVVLNRDHRLAGIVSLGDLATDVEDEALMGHTLEGISLESQPPQEALQPVG